MRRLLQQSRLDMIVVTTKAAVVKTEELELFA